MSFILKINRLIHQNLSHAGIEELSSHYLYQHLPTKPIFIDLGANTGQFYLHFQQKFNGIGYAIEASPFLYQQLPKLAGVTCYHYAVTNHHHPIDFYISENTEANSLNNAISEQWGLKEKVTVPGITLGTFISQTKISAPIDVLKIDIEGAELQVFEVISSATLAQIAQIAVEFHDFLIDDINYHQRMHQSIRKLKNHDFKIIRFSLNDYREVLCINKKLIKLNWRIGFRISILHPFFLSIKKVHRFLSKLKN